MAPEPADGLDSPVRRNSYATGAALVCAVVLSTAGCGSSEDSPDAAAPTTAASARTSSAPSPSAPAAELPDDVCSVVSAADVSAAVGGKVTLSTAPGGDCSYQQEDLRAISGGLGVVTDLTPGSGYESYVSGLDATMTSPEHHPVDGLSGDATVVIGAPTMGSGENLMAAGVVDKGDHALTVTLSQGQGIAASKLVAVAGALLRLLDAAID